MPLLLLTATVWLGRCHTVGNAGNPQPGRTQIVPFGRDHDSRASGPVAVHNGGDVRAITMDRPRFVTASVLRPSPAASSSRVGRPAAASADSAGSLRDRRPGREAGRFGMGPAVVLGQDLAEVPGPARDG